MMPAKYIRKIGEEMWEGMKVCAKYARNEPLGPSKTSDEEETDFTKVGELERKPGELKEYLI